MGCLAALRSRLHWQRGIIIVARAALLAALALLLGTLGVSAGLVAAGDLAGIVAAVFVGLGLGLSLLQRASYLETAKVVDRHHGLKERLATAVELSLQNSRGYLVEAQTSQARATVSGLNPRCTLPRHWPLGDLKSLGLTLALAAGLATLNGCGFTLSALYPAVKEAVIAASPAKVADMVKADQEKAPWQDPGLPPDDDRLPISDAAAAMQPGKSAERIVRSEALVQALERLGPESTAQALAQSLEQNDLGDASAELRNLAEQAQQMSPEAKQEMAAALRQGAQKLAEKSPGLAQKLSDLADALGSGSKDAQKKALDNLNNEIARNDSSQPSGPTPSAQQQGQPQGDRGSAESNQGDAQASAQDQADQSGSQSDQSKAQSPGAGSDPGSGAKSDLHRLQGDGKQLPLDGQKRQGPSDFQRLNSGSNSRTGDTQALTSDGSGMGSSQPLGVAPDSNYVPWDLKGVVRDYFSDQEGR